jgi:hypothetical protein
VQPAQRHPGDVAPFGASRVPRRQAPGEQAQPAEEAVHDHDPTGDDRDHARGDQGIGRH